MEHRFGMRAPGKIGARAFVYVGYNLYFCAMLTQKILRYITENRLFDFTDKVLVAVSGGADSVALLRLLHDAGYCIEALHCNFCLRGEESDSDEAFVIKLCNRLKVPLHRQSFDTLGYAAAHKVSVEMAARQLRYDWFESVRRRTEAAVVAVAHHRDDSVETFLLNLVRGTGINGLKGIRPLNGKVVRPLLEVGRTEIIDFLASLGQDYVTDSTNLTDIYIRNKIRLRVIPLLQEINPSVADTILQTAARLADVDTVYRTGMEEACRAVCPTANCISIPQLLAQPAPRAVLFELLHPLGFNTAQLSDIFRALKAEPGRRFYSSSYVLLLDREVLLWQPREEERYGKPAPRLVVEIKDVCADYTIPRSADVACLDADKVQLPLTLRRWQSDDRFMPYGMRHFKKVSHYLRDRKRSLFEREEQYVVCTDTDIVWLVGERSDHRFRVTEQTRRIMLLHVEQ